MTLRRSILCLAALLLLPVARGRAQARSNDSPILSIRAAGGYFHHDTHWSIAGNAKGTNPNIYSELIWKDLRGPSLYATATGNVRKRWTLSGHLTTAFITAGRVTDTDYAGDNRTHPIYTGTYAGSEGTVTTWHLTAGYHLLRTPRLTLTLRGGYSEHLQSLYIIADLPHSASLRSRYTAAWRGPQLTAETYLRLTRHITLNTTLTLHQLRYTAAADWNLSATLQHPTSFEHTANGSALTLMLQPGYRLTRHLALFLHAGYRRQKTGKGDDTLYLTNGQHISTRFNGARGTLLTTGLGIHYAW